MSELAVQIDNLHTHIAIDQHLRLDGVPSKVDHFAGVDRREHVNGKWHLDFGFARLHYGMFRKTTLNEQNGK